LSVINFYSGSEFHSRERKPAGSPRIGHKQRINRCIIILSFPAELIFSNENWRAGQLRGFSLVLELFIFLAKSFNPARSVNQFLFPGKKRMTLGTNFNTDIGFGRANFDLIAASTSNIGLGIFRMNLLFHNGFNPLQIEFGFFRRYRVGGTGPPAKWRKSVRRSYTADISICQSGYCNYPCTSQIFNKMA